MPHVGRASHLPPERHQAPRQALASTCMVTDKFSSSSRALAPSATPGLYPPLSTGNEHSAPLHRHICNMSSDLRRGEPQGAPLPNSHHMLRNKTGQCIYQFSHPLNKCFPAQRFLGEDGEGSRTSTALIFFPVASEKQTLQRPSTAHYTGSGVG